MCAGALLFLCQGTRPSTLNVFGQVAAITWTRIAHFTVSFGTRGQEASMLRVLPRMKAKRVQLPRLPTSRRRDPRWVSG